MSIVPWGAIIPDDGVMSNSFGDGMMVLPTSLILLSIRLSRLCESSLEMPSAGTRKLNVMGMREVLTKVQWRVLTKPGSTQNNTSQTVENGKDCFNKESHSKQSCFFEISDTSNCSIITLKSTYFLSILQHKSLINACSHIRLFLLVTVPLTLSRHKKTKILFPTNIRIQNLGTSNKFILFFQFPRFKKYTLQHNYEDNIFKLTYKSMI